MIAHLLAQTTTAAATAATAATEAAAQEQPWELYGWYVVAAIALALTAVFSGAEIGLYSLSKVRLHLRTAKKDPAALTLDDWLQHPTYALEGLLVLQNLAAFVFSAAVTAILHEKGFSEAAEALISIAIVTPMVLVLAEIIPKDLFHTYADRWTYRLVPMLRWMFRLVTIIPLLPIVNALGRVSAWLFHSPNKEVAVASGPRTEIVTLFEESVATGVLTGTQQDLVQRALRLARINVRDVMIPWNRVVGVPASISAEGFRALIRRYNVSRMPVLGKSTTEVLGVIDVLDVLTASAGAGDFRITSHLTPVMTLIGEQSVRSAITLMQRARQTLAVVVDRNGRAIGLVTMKDLIEELVGDLENW